MSSQPMELFRFGMFFAISLLVVFVGQSIGLMIGAWFDVVVKDLIQFIQLFLMHFLFDLYKFNIYFFINIY